MNQVLHLESGEILGRQIHFEAMPNKIKSIFYNIVFPITRKHHIQLMFFKQTTSGHYGCVDKAKGVIIE